MSATYSYHFIVKNYFVSIVLFPQSTTFFLFAILSFVFFRSHFPQVSPFLSYHLYPDQIFFPCSNLLLCQIIYTPTRHFSLRPFYFHPHIDNAMEFSVVPGFYPHVFFSGFDCFIFSGEQCQSILVT